MSTPISYLIIRANGRVTSDDDIKKYRSIMNKKRITHEWNIQHNGITYKLRLYAEEKGSYKKINKHEFPPPIDNTLFYGDVFILGFKENEPFGMTTDLWKLFRRHTFQFENLDHSAATDEHEIDELKLVPMHMKTKHGYLKDGFVVDDDDDDDE